jgi:hypothetical protein
MAAGVLKRLSGVQLSDERLRQLTNGQGSILAKQQQAQAQQVLQEAVSMSQIRAQREASGHMPKQKQPELLQVGLDGGWLPSREQKGGMEGKIGVVARKPGYGGQTGAAPARPARRYVATFGPADDTSGCLPMQPPVIWERLKPNSRLCRQMGPSGSKRKRASTFPMR